MIVPCMLNASWMKIGCKLHLDVIIVLTWCHVISYATIILCDFSKAIRKIGNQI